MIINESDFGNEYNNISTSDEFKQQILENQYILEKFKEFAESVDFDLNSNISEVWLKTKLKEILKVNK